MNSNIDKYAKKCEISGEGMNEGWYIDGKYFSEQHMADKEAMTYCKVLANGDDYFYKDFAELYQECEDSEEYNFCYWSEWNVEDDELDTYYDSEGNEYTNN